MVGPDLNGRGGISRVVQIWKNNGVFRENSIKYLSSTSETAKFKIVFSLRQFLIFLISMFADYQCVYIHTAAYRSFYRKTIFIFLSLLFSRKIVLHIHPNDFQLSLNQLRGVNKYLIFKMLERVTAFVVLSEEMRSYMGSLFPDAKIFVLANPVDFEELTDQWHHIRSSEALLYLGWFIREKGVYDLVDAVAHLREKGIAVRLDFYGTKEAARLQDYVAENNLADLISVHGWVTGTEKVELLYRCAMLILPSYSEGVPNVILEAMATRTPIVSTKVGGLKEILKERENAFIAEPGNPVKLSEEILDCLSNKELRNKFTDNAYLYVREIHDIAVVKVQFSKIIQSCLV